MTMIHQSLVQPRAPARCVHGDIHSYDTRLANTAPNVALEVVEVLIKPPPLPNLTPVKDFPLKQSRDDTLCSAFDQVMKIDGQEVRLGAAITHPHFGILRE